MNDPFLVCNYTQLDMIRTGLTSNYILGDNINASPSCGGDCNNPSGPGWEPIPSGILATGDTLFEGTLDGDVGYIIYDLYVNVSGAMQVGLAPVSQHAGLVCFYKNWQRYYPESRPGGGEHKYRPKYWRERAESYIGAIAARGH